MTFTGKWPTEHDDALKVLFAKGLSFAQIAGEINAMFPGASYSRNAAIGRGHRLGLGQANKPKAKKPSRTSSIPPAIQRSPGRRPSKPTAPEVPPGAARAGLVGEGAEAAQPFTVTIAQLRKHHCRWPSGDRAPYLFCGHIAIGPYSYCAFHTRMSLRAA